MSEVILVAIISFAGTILGSLFGVLAANKLTNYRVEQLEKKVDMHNQVIERVYQLEQVSAVRDEEMKEVNHKLSNLEKKVA